MEEFYIKDDRIRIHIKLSRPENTERCPLVILIHGLTGHMEERHIIAAANAMADCGFAVMRAEMYGHGQSEGVFSEHTLFKWIANATSVIEYAKTLNWVTDLYLSGHSQGGLLTMLLAGMRPDDFKAIIPLSPALIIPDGARKGNLFGIHFDPNHIPDVLTMGDRTISGNYFRTAQMIHVEEMITKYENPVLIIHGEKDETVPLRYSMEAVRRYRNCRLSVIPDDTHCYDRNLDQVAAAIREFLMSMREE